jgi:hypothetical protein
MPLAAPGIKTQVSACSEHILTEGNLSGATVKVYQNGTTLIGQGTASSSQHWVTIDSGVTLQQGDTIAATQTLGPDTSPLTPEPTLVQGAPANPPAPIFKSHLFGCASCLWLGGMVSGAKYTVIGQNQATLADEVRASGTTGGGSSHVPLNQPLWGGEKLKANEEPCGVASGFANSQPAEAYPSPTLSQPKIDGPLYKCDTNVHGSDCVEGFFVWMRREKNGSLVQEDDSCSLGSANFRANPHLDAGEQVVMWLDSQGKSGDHKDREDCPGRGVDSEVETVLDLNLVPPPHVVEPLCDQGVVVTLTNLRPGAKVIITHDSVEHIGQSTGTGPQDFHVSPLQGGKTVHAIMDICGNKTGKSNEVMVKPQPVSLPAPVLQDPLFSCTDVVHVSNIHSGALVRVYSQMIGLIGSAYVYHDEADLPVSPALMDSDQIHAVQKGCGLNSDKSNVVTVKKPEALPKPEIVEPLYDCGEYVEVKNVVPGAIVEVYVNGAFAGDATVTEEDGSVKVDALLEEDDKVKARQRLCDLISDFSAEVTVQAFIGRWEDRGWYDTNGNPISESDKILAVHATLLRTGKILFFGGDQHTGSLNDNNDIDHTRLLDLETFRIKKITGLTSPPSDVFCAGHSQTATGDLLVAGGTYDWRLEGEHIDHAAADHFIGSRDTWLFNASSESWERKALLNHERPADFVAEHLARWQAQNPGANPQEIADQTALLQAQSDPNDPNALIHRTGGKWYPTVITLPDAKILCVSGHAREEDTRHNNNSLEIYDTATDQWDLVGPKDADLVPRVVGRSYEYPRLLVLSDGTVFSAYNMQDGNVHKWTVGQDADDWTQVAGTIPESDPHSRLNGSAVLLPFRLASGAGGYLPDKVLMTGGRQPQTLEPTATNPSWQATAPRKLMIGGQPPLRRNHGSVILPTGEIFVEGGVEVEQDDDTGVLAAELYDPVKDEWFTLPEARVVRNYHHVSLLMPDGAVYVGGSNIDAGPGLAARIFDIEVFNPWYFCRKRPRLETAPAAVNHGQFFTVMSPDYQEIANVVIVKCGTTTHNFNSDHRLIELPLTKSGKQNELTVQLPDLPNIAIVGYYLLFILNRENVPSLGKFVRVRPKSNCFIATAVYEDGSPQLDTLRAWRDRLLHGGAGRSFVRAYEMISPPVARLLTTIPSLRTPVRKVLDGVVRLLRDCGGDRS